MAFAARLRGHCLSFHGAARSTVSPRTVCRGRTVPGTDHHGADARRTRASGTLMAPSLSATLFAVLIFVFGISTARAMPLDRLQAGLLIPVASGCGLGVHRGPLDGCYPVYGYYAGYGGGYRNNYYTGFNSGGVCSGRGTHLACNPYGICWVACN